MSDYAISIAAVALTAIAIESIRRLDAQRLRQRLLVFVAIAILILRSGSSTRRSTPHGGVPVSPTSVAAVAVPADASAALPDVPPDLLAHSPDAGVDVRHGW